MKIPAQNVADSDECVEDALEKRARGNEFRWRFTSSISHCVEKGFSVEECFGLIWEETLELLPLDEDEQHDLYNELILWAKKGLR